MKIRNLLNTILLATAINFSNAYYFPTNSHKVNKPIGFGKNTIGGDKSGATVYNIKTLDEFFKALNNNGKPNEAKIIYVHGKIQGNTSIDKKTGKKIYLNESDYAPGYTIDSYLDCFGEDGMVWANTTACNQLEKLRLEGHDVHKKAVTLNIGSNTSIYGVNKKSKIKDLFINVKGSDQVIIRHLTIDTPRDFFAEWSPDDGIHGSWNGSLTGIGIQNSTNVWVDNCNISDGENPISKAGKRFGSYIELHDGSLDIWKSSDFITVSNNYFSHHQKTMLIGSSDSMKTDAGHLRVTIHHNVFVNCKERLPRVRFGKVHVYNNYYYATTDAVKAKGYSALSAEYYNNPEIFPNYFIGAGLESDIRSEYNYFEYQGTKAIPASSSIIVYNYGGYRFADSGSLYNGKSLNITQIAESSFEMKCAARIASDEAKGKNPPSWTRETFTSDAFDPSIYYDYVLDKKMKNIVNLSRKTIPKF